MNYPSNFCRRHRLLKAEEDTVFRFPRSSSLSATARPRNFTLRSKSFTPLRHSVRAVERPVAGEVIKPGQSAEPSARNVYNDRACLRLGLSELCEMPTISPQLRKKQNMRAPGHKHRAATRLVIQQTPNLAIDPLRQSRQ